MRDGGAVVQHKHAGRQRHDGAHHMFDEQDREPARAIEFGQDRDHAVDFGRSQARHNFVEQQQLGLGSERARDLEPLAIGKRQAVGTLVAQPMQGEPPEHLVGAPGSVPDVGVMQQRADGHIVQNRKRRERAHDLKRAADAAPAHHIGREPIDALPAESDRTPVRLQCARNHVEQGRLAGTVWTDDGEDVALADLEIGVGDCEQPAKAFADAFDREKCAHARGSNLKLRASHGQTPSGSSRITTRRQMP